MTAKQKYQKYKMLIPVLALTYLCIYTIGTATNGTVEMNGKYYDFTLTQKHYGAIIVVIINLISFSYFRHIFKYIFLLTLLLGFFDFINFIPLETTWFINNSIFGIPQTPFLIGLLTFILNFKTIIKAITSDNGKMTKQKSNDNQKLFREEIENFKNKYINYPTDDLIKIISEKKHIAPAIEAAQQILRDRQESPA